jgi:hypothetical protein
MRRWMLGVLVVVAVVSVGGYALAQPSSAARIGRSRRSQADSCVTLPAQRPRGSRGDRVAAFGEQQLPDTGASFSRI